MKKIAMLVLFISSFGANATDYSWSCVYSGGIFGNTSPDFLLDDAAAVCASVGGSFIAVPVLAGAG